MIRIIRKEPRIPFTKEGYQKLLDEKVNSWLNVLKP